MARPRVDDADRRRAARKLELTRGIASVFWERGFFQTSMTDAAAAIGISKMVLYRYFPDKEALMQAILEHAKACCEAADKCWWERQGERPGLIGAIEIVRSDRASVMLLLRFASHQPEFRSAYDDFIGRTHRNSSARLATWLKIPPSDDPIWHLSVSAISNFAVEGCVQWVEHGDPAQDDSFVLWMRSSLRAVYYGIREQLLGRRSARSVLGDEEDA